MKKVLLVALSLFAIAPFALAQQEYLLIPADTPGTIVINEGYKLKQISSQKIKYNRVARFDGFRIEIYQGNNRKEAKETLEKFIEEHPEVPAEMVFENPYVKIKVGIYRNKLEAQNLYYQLKKEYKGTKMVHGKGLQFPPLNNHPKKEDPEIKVNHVEDF
ncbi:MAG: hypothetical protein ACPGLV_04715 [Bacteroidia bacterium]